MLETFTKQLAALENLSAEEIQTAVTQLIDESISPETKADFLVALAQKGETPDEIAAFAGALREKSIVPPIEQNWREAREILDVVGTGGDHLSTFNISTTVALLCAAAGVAVAKHGNRAVTSSVGSADVIETLGIRVHLTPEEAADHAAAAKNMSRMWATFARTSRPGVPGQPTWPAYDLQSRATMMIEARCHVAKDPYPNERQVWTEIG